MLDQNDNPIIINNKKDEVIVKPLAYINTKERHPLNYSTQVENQTMGVISHIK